MQVERDKIQLEKQMVELEQKALRMQMNPHFIFNALNTIKGYYTEGNYINASTYISKFSKLLRKLLESEEQVTTLDNEIEMLKLYIELKQIRYEGKFDFEIKVDPDLSKEDILIPNLLLQPLVENAIIHGLGPKPMKGMLYINFIKKEELLICEVDDDGIGREASSKTQKNKEYSSKAMEITTERLKLFDTTSSIIIDKKDSTNANSGTKVIITIPLHQERGQHDEKLRQRRLLGVVFAGLEHGCADLAASLPRLHGGTMRDRVPGFCWTLGDSKGVAQRAFPGGDRQSNGGIGPT